MQSIKKPSTMNKLTKSFILVTLLFLTSAVSAVAQKTPTAKEQEAAYTKAITQRADKIVAALDLQDHSKSTRVRDIIARQYRDLRDIHDTRDARIKAAEAKAGEDKAASEAQTKALQAKADTQLAKVHGKYIAKLSAELTPEQVDGVKDGMTYGVLPITYKGYLAMLPDLTEEQKAQIMAHLVEAREHAMDAESSEKKHGWFGKYKGKINNYLSAAGYDLKKAGEEWEKRRKAESAAN